MLTRAQLLKSKLPRPDMSTSPSGLVQAEDVRSSHPKSVQEFDVIPDVMNYISHLGVTPKRFKPVGYGRQHVRFCFAIWVCICLSLLQSCCWHMQFQIVFSGSWVTGLFVHKASLMGHHRCCTCLGVLCHSVLAIHRQILQVYAAFCKRGCCGAVVGACDC